MSSALTSEQRTGVAAHNEELLNPNVEVTHSDGIPVNNATAPPDAPAKPAKHLPSSYYATFLSDLARNRKISPIRSLYPLESTPGLISLLAGKPNPSTFPFTSFSFTARSPIDATQETALTIDGQDLAQGLQYGDTAGLKKLCNWVRGLQERMHGRKGNEGWDVSIGAGSQDLIFKAVTALVNPGDSVLLEAPVYAGVIPMFQNLHCDIIEVETDDRGISTSSLRSILQSWPSGKPRPKVLYTVPYGCNPTGMTATLERRKDVLQFAREYNFIILEDDPYYYLYYGKSLRYPSYFSLELEEPEVGRVLRFDSLSKILSAGIRIGFASGPEILLRAIDQHTSTSNLQTSSLTQMIAFKLLDSWGYDGFKVHTENVSAFYRKKRDMFEHAMKSHLAGLAEWTTPEAGMFYWFKLLLSDDSNAEEGDSQTVIRTNALAQGVLALPGVVFLPNGGRTAYVRAAFSLTSAEDTNEALRRLRQAVLDTRAMMAS